MRAQLYMPHAIPSELKHQTLSDPHTHPNWGQFQEYVTRVRKVRLWPCPNPFQDRPPTCLWAQFSQFTLDKPILPLLQCVNIMDSRISTQDNIPLLLISPSVREMSIWLKVSGLDDDTDTVSEACARVPHLETLSLGINPWIADLSVLHCNSRLRSISLREHLTARDLERTSLLHLAEWVSNLQLSTFHVCAAFLQGASGRCLSVAFWNWSRLLTSTH